MLSDNPKDELGDGDKPSLNAPYGAWCFLTLCSVLPRLQPHVGLNALYGARCFLTGVYGASACTGSKGLNAPYGARCLLTTPDKPTEPTPDKS